MRDLIFFGHVDPEAPLSGVSGGGVLSVAAYLAVVAVGLGVLHLRYRKVDL